MPGSMAFVTVALRLPSSQRVSCLSRSGISVRRPVQTRAAPRCYWRPPPRFDGEVDPVAHLQDARVIQEDIETKRDAAHAAVEAVWEYAKLAPADKALSVVAKAGVLQLQLLRAEATCSDRGFDLMSAMDAELDFVSSEVQRLSAVSVFSAIQTSCASLMIRAAAQSAVVATRSQTTTALLKLYANMQRNEACFGVLASVIIPTVYGDLLLLKAANEKGVPRLRLCVQQMVAWTNANTKDRLSSRHKRQVQQIVKEFNMLLLAVKKQPGAFPEQLQMEAFAWRDRAVLRVLLDAVVTDPDNFHVCSMINNKKMAQELLSKVRDTGIAAQGGQVGMQFNIEYTMAEDGFRELAEVVKKLKQVTGIQGFPEQRNKEAHDRPTVQSLRHVLATTHVPPTCATSVIEPALQLENARGALEDETPSVPEEVPLLPLPDLGVLRSKISADVSAYVKAVHDNVQLMEHVADKRSKHATAKKILVAKFVEVETKALEIVPKSP